MKKIALYSLFTIGILIAVMILFSPGVVIGSKKPVAAGPGNELPDSIMKVVQKACMDCHADDGTSMARSKLNFSKWSGYDAEKQVKKGNGICKELTKNSMPPKKWRGNNPDRIPTQAEVVMLCNWVKTLKP